MSDRSHSDAFRNWAPIFRRLNTWPRPIKPKYKACTIFKWQLPDDQQAPETFDEWMQRFGHHGIGLLMGSPLPDGTRLGALDVDRDEYVALAKVLLGNPPSGRIGQKGVVYFVRYRGQLGNPEFRVSGDANASWGKLLNVCSTRSFVPFRLPSIRKPTVHIVGPALPCMRLI